MARWPAFGVIAAALALAGCGAGQDPTLGGLPQPDVSIEAVVPEPDSAERVVLRNNTSVEADLGLWQILDDDGNLWRFDAGVKIPPASRLTVHAGPGDDAPGNLYLDSQPMIDPDEGIRLVDAGGAPVDTWP